VSASTKRAPRSTAEVERVLHRWATARESQGTLPAVVEWFSVGRWSDRAPRRAGSPTPVWVSVHPGANEGTLIEVRQVSASVRELRAKVFATPDEAWTLARALCELLERAK
jgi:hypothetical protein